MNMLGDEPPYLSVGTEVSAKYKGAFCEAKVRKVDRSVKCKVTFKVGNGTYTVPDNQVKGVLRVGATVEAKHPDKKEFAEATICKIQDCSQYTVVFDDGDITTLRRSALCLKSGRHFAESETLDQLPLTHPEHFGNPVVGGRRGRRRHADDSSGDETETRRKGKPKEEKEADIGKVVCVELGDKKKVKDNWFPGLVVAPNAQDTVRIRVKDEYLVRSFSDGRYYTVPKKEATEFTREIGLKVDNNTLKTAVEKAVYFLDKDELPPHWDRDLLFGLIDSDGNSDSDVVLDSDSSDDEPREEKDHFVAQLYKFMDDRGSPINNCPSINQRDLDLYKLFKVVHKLNGYNRVSNRNQWKLVATKLGLGTSPSVVTQVKHAYKKYLHNFEDFYRKLGCTMVNHPRNNRTKPRSGRSLIRDIDRTTPVSSPKILEPGTRSDTKADDPNADKDASMDSTTSTRSRDEEAAAEAEMSDDTTEDSKPAPEPASTRKKFPTLKASPRTREKRKADVVVEATEVVEARKSKRPRVVREEREQSVEVPDEPKDQQRSSTRSRSKEDMKMRKENERRGKAPVKAADLEGTNKKTPMAKSVGKKKEEKEEKEVVEPQTGIAGNTAGTPNTTGKGKAGRKRRNTECNGRPPAVVTEEDLNLPCVAAFKSIFIGDVLKVYYGSAGEPKVIYEAKVVDMEQDDQGESVYLVHYAGWNSRYDEWVKRNKIADNLSWMPARGKGQPSKPAATSKTIVPKRRPPSVKGDSTAPRSTTPSSVTSSSSRTKSPATPTPTTAGRRHNTRQAGEQRTTRRTRKISGHTDISIDSDSDSESEASGSDTDDKPQKPDRKGPLVEKDENTGKEESIKEAKKSEPAKDKKVPPKRRAVKKVVNKEEAEEVEKSPKPKRLRKPLRSDKEDEEVENEVKKETEAAEATKAEAKDESEAADAKVKTAEEPKGRDFDLNQIRSELKGFDKAVKVTQDCDPDEKQPIILDDRTGIMNVEETAAQPAEPAVEDPGKQEPVVVVPPVEEESSKTTEVKEEAAEPEKETSQGETSQQGEDKDAGDSLVTESKEDIYEFKEPEPFEFTEVRRSISTRIFDEERSPEKRIKSPSVSPRSTPTPEKKETSLFEVDMKSRFRKTIGKKMKDLTGTEKREPIVSVEKVDLRKLELAAILPKLKSPEKEIPVLKVEADVWRCASPEVPVLLVSDDPDRTVGDMEPLHKPPDDSPEPPCLVPITSNIFSTTPASEEDKEEDKEDTTMPEEEEEEEEEDPISAAIQRVIAQSSIDEDSDHLEMLPGPAPLQPAPLLLPEPAALPKPQCNLSYLPKLSRTEDKVPKLSRTEDKVPRLSRAEDKVPKLSRTENKVPKLSRTEDKVPKLSRTEDKVPKLSRTEDKVPKLSRTEDKVPKRVPGPAYKRGCTKRRGIGKRLSVNKASSESGSDSDSAGERLVIVNEDSAGEVESDVPSLPSLPPLPSLPSLPSVPTSVIETKKRSPLAEVRLKRKSPLPASSLPPVVHTLQHILPSPPSALPPPLPTTSSLVLPDPLSPQTHDALPVKITYIPIPTTSSQVIDSVARNLCTSVSTSPPAASSSAEKNEEEWRSMGAPKEPEEGESNLKSLLCEETIPGSPAGQETCKEEPSHSQSSQASQSSQPSQNPQSNQNKPVHVALHAVALKRDAGSGNDAAVVMDNTPPTTPESTLSTISGSPREDRVGSSSLDNESSKSHRDSSEVDLDNENDQRLRSMKLAGKTRDSERREAEAANSHPVKKKRRSRKRSESLSEMNKRLRGSRSCRGRSDKGADSDSDDQSEGLLAHSMSCDPSLMNSRSPRPSKYNFFCDLGPDLDATQRIALLQQKLQDLRKTYMNVKGELASIDRRRKKLRRREREEKAAAVMKSQEVACP